MAVIQISKIQVRRGLQENLPQLGSGEMGWSIDERRLYIGNGTLAEGTPEIGNTEILTIYSPIGAALSNIAIIEDEINVIQGNIANLQANSTTFAYSVGLADYNNVALSANIILTSPTNILDYRISRATSNILATSYRVGTIKISNLNGVVSYQDDYSETADTGITLSVTSTSGNTAVIQYISSSTGYYANLTYYLPRTFI